MGWLSTDQFKEPQEEKKPQVLSVDFDGTLVENEYPHMGKPCEGAVEFIRELIGLGWKIILETLRTDNELNQAVVYCNQNYIDLWGINENPDQDKWNKSVKIYSTLKIDDRNVGIPLKIGSNGKPCVDWAKTRNLFVQWEVLPPKDEPNDGTKTFQIK